MKVDPQLISQAVLAILLVASTLGAKLTTDQRKKRRQMRKLRDQTEILTEMVVDLRAQLIARGVKRADLPKLPTDAYEDEEDDEPRVRRI